ncbi:MAG: hypothetical protein J0H18_09335 [Rhizobiales bacterium]|nr:hypothetical protein [Hyphomicrobiales bacterium]
MRDAIRNGPDADEIPKRAPILQIRFPRFDPLFFRVPLSQNRCALLRDTPQV